MRDAKLWAGTIMLALALPCAVVAIVGLSFAPLGFIFGVLLGGTGLGLLCEATDPRRRPNPRTAHRRTHG